MLADRLKRVPAWVVLLVLAAAVAGYAWWRSRQAKAADQAQADQGETSTAPDTTMPASTAGLVAPMVYAQNGQSGDQGEEDTGTTSSTPPVLNSPQAAPPWLYGGNTATPASTYSTGHPTPVTYT